MATPNPNNGVQYSKHPYITYLRHLSSPLNPLQSIISDFSANNDKIDILRLDLGRTFYNGSSSLNLTAKYVLNHDDHCAGFVNQIRNPRVFPPHSHRVILLLVEDISLATINFLCGGLNVPPSFIHEFYSSNKKTSPTIIDELEKDKQPKNDNWKFFDNNIRHRWAKEFRVLNRRNINFEGDGIFHMDWSRISLMESRVLHAEGWTFAHDAGKSLDILQPKTLYSFDSFVEAGFHRESRIYREHYPITAEDRDIKTHAAYENMSRIRGNIYGHEIVIFLFDPQRTISNGNGAKEFDVFCGVGERVGPREEFAPLLKAVNKANPNEPPTVKTTRDLFVEYLEHWSRTGRLDTLTTCEVHFMRGILIEYCATLSTMEDTLDLIDRSMMDTIRLQEKVKIWNPLLSSYRPILADMSNFAKRLQNTLWSMRQYYPRYAPGYSFSIEVDRTDYSLGQFTEYRLQVEGRVEKTFQALMSSISILANQEAILEASAISKLTELMFFFIPLQSAMAFYGMQIETLDATVSKFLTLAASLLASAYGVRVIIMSRLPYYLQMKFKKPVLESGSIIRKEDITASVYVYYYWKKFFEGSLYYQLMGFLLYQAVGIPLVLLCATKTEFKVTATILTVLSGSWISSMPRFLDIRDWAKNINRSIIVVSAFGILGVSIESSLEIPVKTSISCSLGLLLAMTAESSIRNMRLFTRFIAWACFCTIPAILLWHPWSLQPQMQMWEKGMAMIGFFDFSLLFPLGALGRSSPAERFAYSTFFVSSIFVGMPLILIWSYGYPVRPVSRAVQITVTSVSLWVFIAGWYFFCERRSYFYNSPGSRKLLQQGSGGIAFAVVLAFFPLILWLGEVGQLDSLNMGSKVGLTISWVWAWALLAGYSLTWRQYRNEKRAQDLAQLGIKPNVRLSA